MLIEKPVQILNSELVIQRKENHTSKTVWLIFENELKIKGCKQAQAIMHCSKNINIVTDRIQLHFLNWTNPNAMQMLSLEIQ